MRTTKRSSLADRRGNVAVMMALAAPALVGVAGLSVETGYWYFLQKSAQKAADVSAYAGAISLRNGDQASTAAATALSEAGLLGWAAPQETVTPAAPPTVGSYQGSNRAVEVTINYEAPRFFSAIFSTAPVTASVRSVAAFQEGARACLLSLDTDASRAFTLSGSANVALTACEVMSNSIAADSVYLGGTGGIESDCINSVGEVAIGTNADMTLNACAEPRELMPRALDPFADVPEPSVSGAPCDAIGAAAAVDAGANGLKRFCGGVTLTGNRTFAPGVYVIDGGVFQINAGANVSGAGVTFFLTNNAYVQINGSATVNFSAPLSGPYQGIVFFADRDNNASITHIFNGTANSLITGAIYAPSSKVQFNGNYSGLDGCMQIVSATMELRGSLELSSDCTAYSLKFPRVPQSVRVVE